MKKPDILIGSILLLIPFSGSKADEAGLINLSKRFPIQGQSTLVYVVDQDNRAIQGAKVKVTYRPESRVEKAVDLGSTDEAGMIEWIPKDAGVVVLSADWPDNPGQPLDKRVSVRFSSLPRGGILIMIFAGLLLIGGSVMRFIRILKTPNVY